MIAKDYQSTLELQCVLASPKLTTRQKWQYAVNERIIIDKTIDRGYRGKGNKAHARAIEKGVSNERVTLFEQTRVFSQLAGPRKDGKIETVLAKSYLPK